jgi:hypothetical protein
MIFNAEARRNGEHPYMFDFLRSSALKINLSVRNIDGLSSVMDDCQYAG